MKSSYKIYIESIMLVHFMKNKRNANYQLQSSRIIHTPYFIPSKKKGEKDGVSINQTGSLLPCDLNQTHPAKWNQLNSHQHEHYPSPPKSST